MSLISATSMHRVQSATFALLPVVCGFVLTLITLSATTGLSVFPANLLLLSPANALAMFHIIFPKSVLYVLLKYTAHLAAQDDQEFEVRPSKGS